MQSPLKVFPSASQEELLLSLQDELKAYLWKKQKPDGHWHFSLDDNITMNAEYILFHKWLGLPEEQLLQRLANHILKTQNHAGSWSLYYEGPGNLSATVEAYFALKFTGFKMEDELLQKAKEFILSQGGIPQTRVFTKIWLALFGLYPWEGIPMIPPEIIFAPSALPLNVYEFSYWSRLTIISLTILFHLRKAAPAPFTLDELYCHSEDKKNIALLEPPPANDSWVLRSRKIDLSWINWEQVFRGLNKGVMFYESKVPLKPLRQYAIEKAKKWILEHQEENGGWGGIQPPMINSIMALHASGTLLSEPPIQKGLRALKNFTRGVSASLDTHSHETCETAVLQSCVSPIWDTALSALALLESGEDPHTPRLQMIKNFLWENRIQKKSDWNIKAKVDKPFAAWCFQYENSNYPDVDDSAVVALVLSKLGMTFEELNPAIHWLLAMQCSDGGWGSFDKDNNQILLNRIPFADLKSLIDPSSPDVTGHVLETFAELGLAHAEATKKAIRYLKRTQKEDGSWFGRWGVSFIYGTSAAVVGLRKCSEPIHSPYVQKALQFLLSKQNEDGGWGEACSSYSLHARTGHGPSTPSQTAWALLALEACRPHKESFKNEIERALAFFQSQWTEENALYEPYYTGTGFPEHFYLRYDGYRTYFPLIALGRLSRFK